MAISTEYRMPGVYSNEVSGPRLNLTSGGNAVVAFIGPAVGYRSASQQAVLNGTDEVPLGNTGVIADSYAVTGRSSGTRYSLGEDFAAVQDADGTTSISRLIKKLSTATETVDGKKFTYYVAQPTFNILVDDNGDPIDGYVIKGTVSIPGYTEGVDYAIDYHSNIFMARSGGKLENAVELAISYKWTTAEPVELMGEASYTLDHRFVSKDAMNGSDGAYTMKLVSAKVGDNEYGDTPGASNGYIEGVDYVIDYDTGRLTRTASSRIPSFSDEQENYMYAEFGYCAIKSGETVVIDYKYSDPSYNKAKFFSSYNEMASVYGNPWNERTGEVQSEVSMAAYIASRNGMSSFYGVAVKPVVVDGSAPTYPISSWEAAFDELTIVDGIDIIVPVSGDQAIWDMCREHIAKMKENQDERVAIVGADGSSEIVPSDTMIAMAQSLNDDDIWMVGPSSFRFRNPITAVVSPVGGQYAAAAVAGVCSTQPQYVPLTQKSVTGFYSANEYETKVIKKNELANGVMYIDEVSGGLRVLHGRTTSTASIVEQEANIVLTKYYIIKTMRRAFANGYIGSIITDSTLLGIKSAANSILCNLRDNNYIAAFSGLVVSVDEMNQTQVNVSFEYQPVYSMNYIDITFSVDATTTASI